MKLLFTVVFILNAFFAIAGGEDELTPKEKKAMEKKIDSIEKAMHFQTGNVVIGNGVATLNIPSSFKFLGKEQANYIIEQVWGNPPQTDILGMIFPKNAKVVENETYAFVVSYQEDGYIKDKDADGINYDDMLKDMQSAEPESNKQRATLGYESIHIVGWAQKPFYDKTKKILHWAKEIQFNNMPDHTLNYDVRVLGRKGVLSLNAVSGIEQLGLVKQNIDSVLTIAQFNKGYTYEEFNSSTDKVAAYGIGALVGAKVLAKVGILAKFGKFFAIAWKFILLGIVGLWAAIKKLFTRKKQDEYEIEKPVKDSTPSEHTPE
jgi:uncharacterized membrane-anchored protein